jgi:hypothetical protein
LDALHGAFMEELLVKKLTELVPSSEKDMIAMERY